MNAPVADYPDQEIPVVRDSLSTHKPTRAAWQARHQNVQRHFTPTHAGWLNQVEIGFSILARSALAGASFPSVQALRAAIGTFIEASNASAAPFQWRKLKAYPKGLASRITDLC